MQLYNALYSKEYEILKATGCLDGHCETGFLIYDISLDEALKLGRLYEQYAIFFNDTKYLKYILCESEEVVVEIKRKNYQS